MLSKAVLPDPLYAWEYLSSSLSLTLYVFLYSLHVYSEMLLIISLSLFLWCLDFNLRICFCWSTYTYLDIYRICLHGPLNRCLNMFSRCAPVYTCLTPIAFVPVSSCVAGGLVRQKLLKEFIEKCYQPQNAHGNTVFPLQARLEAVFKIRQMSRDWRKTLQGFEWLTADDMRKTGWPKCLGCAWSCNKFLIIWVLTEVISWTRSGYICILYVYVYICIQAVLKVFAREAVHVNIYICLFMKI